MDKDNILNVLSVKLSTGVIGHAIKDLFIKVSTKRNVMSWLFYYPHMPIGKVWIYRLLFVCLFVF